MIARRRLARGIILAVAFVALLASAVLSAASPPSPDDPNVLTLQNAYVSASWLIDLHTLQSFTRLDASGASTEFLNAAVLSASSQSWWTMYLVIPDAAPMRIDAYTESTEKTVELRPGDGYTNATFAYMFNVAEGQSVYAVIDAQLRDNATTIEFYMRLEKNTAVPDFPVGLLNATVTLQAIDPSAGGKAQHRDGTGQDQLVLPSGYGMLIADPTTTYTDPYPAHYPNSDATYASLMYYFNHTDAMTGVANGLGLIVEAHDPLGSNKIRTYQLTPPSSPHVVSPTVPRRSRSQKPTE